MPDHHALIPISLFTEVTAVRFYIKVYVSMLFEVIYTYEFSSTDVAVSSLGLKMIYFDMPKQVILRSILFKTSIHIAAENFDPKDFHSDYI